MKRITSRQNPVVARFRAATRRETPEFILLDGVHLVAEAVAAGLEIAQAVIVSDAASRPDITPVIARLNTAGVDLVSASAQVMGAVSPLRTPSPIVALARRPATATTRVYAGTPLVVVAVDIQDPGNVGAIARVAEAGGASGLVIAGACADPLGWKALRGSMGSALRLPILAHASGPDALAEARGHRCRSVATVPRNGRPLFEVDLTGPLAIIVGGEGQGLDPAVVAAADERVTIPMKAPVESLNTAVTAAILIYEAVRQRQ